MGKKGEILVGGAFHGAFAVFYLYFILEGHTTMKKTVFTGAATAIITPFKNDKIDFESFAKLINWQINEGIDAIVVCGTTGEASTLTDEEHKAAIEFAVKEVAGRVPVIAGTGSNDTAYAIEMTEFACNAGADAVLVVTPYYNKATQAGLIKMFSSIADASTKPVILYNVPSRTGCNILPATAAKLAEHDNIVAIKEASGNLSQIAELAHLVGDKMDIYSGNDDQIVPIMSLGGKGVISVLSNILPKETHDMTQLCLEGNFSAATELQLKYLKLINTLFCEVNPVPVKTAAALLGWCSDEMRLPLCEMEDANKDKLIAAMKAHGLL